LTRVFKIIFSANFTAFRKRPTDTALIKERFQRRGGEFTENVHLTWKYKK